MSPDSPKISDYSTFSWVLVKVKFKINCYILKAVTGKGNKFIFFFLLKRSKMELISFLSALLLKSTKENFSWRSLLSFSSRPRLWKGQQNQSCFKCFFFFLLFLADRKERGITKRIFNKNLETSLQKTLLLLFFFIRKWLILLRSLILIWQLVIFF